MNPAVLFLPTYRASMTAFVLGLVVLAIIDFARMSSDIPYLSGAWGMLVLWFFVYSLHANRLRHAGRETGLASLPVGVAVIGKGIGFLVGLFPGIYASMLAFAEQNGVDTSDQVALAEALQDPAFSESWVASIEGDTALQEALVAATNSGSFIGFWLVIALFAIWFAQMKRLGGSLDGVPEDTPSMLNPEPIAPVAPVAPAPAREETAPETAAETPAEATDEQPTESADDPSDDNADGGAKDDETPKT